MSNPPAKAARSRPYGQLGDPVGPGGRVVKEVGGQADYHVGQGGRPATGARQGMEELTQKTADVSM